MRAVEYAVIGLLVPGTFCTMAYVMWRHPMWWVDLLYRKNAQRWGLDLVVKDEAKLAKRSRVEAVLFVLIGMGGYIFFLVLQAMNGR